MISIVFSFKDEEKNLLELVNRVTKVFEEIKNWNYELIFVNDASADKSEEILTKLQNDYPITIINMSRNFFKYCESQSQFFLHTLDNKIPVIPHILIIPIAN